MRRRGRYIRRGLWGSPSLIPGGPTDCQQWLGALRSARRDRRESAEGVVAGARPFDLRRPEPETARKSGTGNLNDRERQTSNRLPAQLQLNCPGVVIHSRRPLIEYHPENRLVQILRIADFVPEAEPYGLFLACGQALQHALGPDGPFHPGPSVRGFSSSFRKGRAGARASHCRWFVFGHWFLHASTFLRPLAPRSLPASSLLRTL